MSGYSYWPVTEGEAEDASCRFFDSSLRERYATITATLSFISIIAILLCVITLIKLRRSKQLQSSEVIMPSGGANQENHSTTLSHSPYNRDLGNLPPMGSAEAEFQNDFIQVFPMHHLEPCPEKNMTALMQ